VIYRDTDIYYSTSFESEVVADHAKCPKRSCTCSFSPLPPRTTVNAVQALSALLFQKEQFGWCRLLSERGLDQLFRSLNAVELFIGTRSSGNDRLHAPSSTRQTSPDLGSTLIHSVSRLPVLAFKLLTFNFNFAFKKTLFFPSNIAETTLINFTGSGKSWLPF
jgi:hypothetical protein